MSRHRGHKAPQCLVFKRQCLCHRWPTYATLRIIKSNIYLGGVNQAETRQTVRKREDFPAWVPRSGGMDGQQHFKEGSSRQCFKVTQFQLGYFLWYCKDKKIKNKLASSRECSICSVMLVMLVCSC